MTTWILILSLARYSSASMDHIEFNSRESCIAAANYWIDHVHGDLHNKTAMCVQK